MGRYCSVEAIEPLGHLFAFQVVLVGTAPCWPSFHFHVTPHGQVPDLYRSCFLIAFLEFGVWVPDASALCSSIHRGQSLVERDLHLLKEQEVQHLN